MFESKLFGQIVGMGGYDFGEPIGHIDPLDQYRKNIKRMSGEQEAKVDNVVPDEPSKVMPQYNLKQVDYPAGVNMDIWREFFGKKPAKLDPLWVDDRWSSWVFRI
jgi:hypothetical protein